MTDETTPTPASPPRTLVRVLTDTGPDAPAEWISPDGRARVTYLTGDYWQWTTPDGDGASAMREDVLAAVRPYL